MQNYVYLYLVSLLLYLIGNLAKVSNLTRARGADARTEVSYSSDRRIESATAKFEIFLIILAISLVYFYKLSFFSNPFRK